MGLTRQWLETKPAVTDKIKDGPAEFQARWKDVRELLNSAGITCDSVNPLAEQGRLAVNASGTGIHPAFYKSDRATKILEFLDAGGTLLAGYPLSGSKNIPEATVADGVVGVDAKGYKRAMEPLRIFESSPVDTKVNVKAGVYTKTGGQTIGYFAGGQLTIGIAPLTLPAAGNHAYYGVYLDGSGTLTAIKGAEVLIASTPTAPNFPAGSNIIAIIDIRDTSANFSLATSGANAFLVSDARPDTQLTLLTGQVAQATSGALTQGANVRQSKAITTAGGVVLAIGYARGAFAGERVSIGRAGTPISEDPNVATSAITLIGLEAIAAGTYTYELRMTLAPTHTRLSLIELGPTAVV